MSIIAGIIGVIFGISAGWTIFPSTIAPLLYLTKSELEIWCYRMTAGLIGGFAGGAVLGGGAFLLFGN